MVIPAEIAILAAGQLVVVTAAFIAVKTDTKWIKSRLSSGDKRLSRHAALLNQHTACIAVLKGQCLSHHGTQFPACPPSVGNGDEGNPDE